MGKNNMIRKRKNTKKENSAKTIMLKILNKGKVVYHIKSGTISRFRTAIRTRNGDEYRIKVGYGKKLDNFGEMSEFDNSGTYKNKHDALLAFNAFVEE